MTDVIFGIDHSVPPHSEMKVICTVNSSYEHGLISSNNSELKFQVMDGVIKLKDNGNNAKECFAIVLNMGNETIHLSRKTIIGKLKDSFRMIFNL